METFRSRRNAGKAQITLSDMDGQAPTGSTLLDEAKLALAAASAADAGTPGRYALHPRWFERTEYSIVYDPGLTPNPSAALETLRQALVKAAAAHGSGATLAQLRVARGDTALDADEEDEDVAV